MSAIVVLSKMRSGSSAVAGTLHHLGIPMGEFKIGYHPINPKGFYEDQRFVAIHRKIMQGDWESKEPYDMESHRTEYRNLIRQRDQEGLWGIKDPRMCFFLNEFTKHVNAKVIAVERSIEDCVDSFMRAKLLHRNYPNGFTREEIVKLFERYERAKEESLNKFQGEILRVQFDELTDDTPAQVKRIADFIGVPVTDEALQFINPEFKGAIRPETQPSQPLDRKILL